MQASFPASTGFTGISLLSRLARPFQSAAKAVASDATARERMIVAGYQETLSQVQATDFSASHYLLSTLR